MAPPNGTAMIYNKFYYIIFTSPYKKLHSSLKLPETERANTFLCIFLQKMTSTPLKTHQPHEKIS